ncbi:MAG TPA: hypothetical protein VFP47_17025, partial [Pyrinomonadaceae bacterium]|nr:hypothetical protein [Pyrinomonadaceae bacterium]
MFVALHWKTFKPALPNMPPAAVMLVITPYVTDQEPLHASAQRLVMGSLRELKLDALVRRRYLLGQINEAIDDLQHGRI